MPVNGCLFKDAVPLGGMQQVHIVWQKMLRQPCIVVDTGTEVTFLAGVSQDIAKLVPGVAPEVDTDPTNPINNGVVAADKMSVAVTFTVANDYPFFAEMFPNDFLGVVYARTP